MLHRPVGHVALDHPGVDPQSARVDPAHQFSPCFGNGALQVLTSETRRHFWGPSGIDGMNAPE